MSEPTQPPREIPERLDLTALRRVAAAADKDGKPWFWKASGHPDRGGYPQQVFRWGDVGLICETYDEPDHPSITPEYIATFDPPTVLALLELARKGLRAQPQAVRGRPAAVTERRANGPARGSWDDEDEVRRTLMHSLPGEQTDRWLNAPNVLLAGRTPRELLAEGRAAEVRDAAEAFVDGDPL